MADKYSRSGESAPFKVDGSTAIDVGDLVYLSSGNLTVVSSRYHPPIGIAETSVASGAITPVTVNLFDDKKVYDMTLGSAATLSAGDYVRYTSDKALVKCTIHEGAIGEVAEDMTASGTAVRVRMFRPKRKIKSVTPLLIGKPNEIFYLGFGCDMTLESIYLGVGLTGTAGSFTLQVLDDNTDILTTDPTVAYNATQAQENPKKGVVDSTLAKIAAQSKIGLFLSAVQTNGAYAAVNAEFSYDAPTCE